jgi:hypothetical protein
VLQSKNLNTVWKTTINASERHVAPYGDRRSIISGRLEILFGGDHNKSLDASGGA